MATYPNSSMLTLVELGDTALNPFRRFISLSTARTPCSPSPNLSLWFPIDYQHQIPRLKTSQIILANEFNERWKVDYQQPRTFNDLQKPNNLDQSKHQQKKSQV